MNVKPGDMAIVIRGKQLAGRIVEVLARAPSGVSFALPDGYSQLETDYEWVVRFVGSPVEAPIGFAGKQTGTRTAFYGCAPDRVLRPISGVPVTDEVTEDLKEPA